LNEAVKKLEDAITEVLHSMQTWKFSQRYKEEQKEKESKQLQTAGIPPLPHSVYILLLFIIIL